MFDAVLQQIQAKIRALHYVMTIHAEEEMDDDGLSIYDVESAILNGHIVERQRDKNTNEWKYLVRGHTEQDRDVEIVVKVSSQDTAIIITVYLV